MLDSVRRLCRDALAEKRVDVIYGLKAQGSDVVPAFFDNADDLEHLVLDARHRLFYTLRPSNEDVVGLVQQRYPDLKIGVVARGCDERALFELAKRTYVKLDRIEVIGVACDRKQAEECRCSRPYPRDPVAGTKVEGIADDAEVAKFLEKSLADRLAFWKYQLSKCIKCYGCRNACPVCACKECRMEQSQFTPGGRLPVEFPLFHFVQFMHHADRCIDCGECENACPMDIPLRLIKKIMRDEVRTRFGYDAGADATAVSPFATVQTGGTSDAVC